MSDNSVNWSLGALACLASVAVVILEAELARRDGMLTVAQMRRTYPKHVVGLPFIWHFGMWGDLFVITPLLGWSVAVHSHEWTVDPALQMFALGGVASAVFHLHFAQTPFPDSLVWKEKLSRSGYVHAIYTAVVLAILGLLFFATPSISRTSLVLAAIAAAIHVTLASKIFLGLVNRLALNYEWCPVLLKEVDQWATLGAAYLAIITFTWLAF